jgi:hypothetical protein
MWMQLRRIEMRQHHLTTTPGHAHNEHHHSWSRSVIQHLRSSGRFWHKVFSAILLLSMVLISPMGVAPAHALDAPILISPENVTFWTEDNAPPLAVPEFKWMEVVGATSYRIQICHSPSSNCDTTPYVNKTTPNTTFMPTSASGFTDGDYFWRVRVEAPSVNAWSEAWMFNKDWSSDTNAPSLIAPSNSATIDFYDYPLFSWTPVMGAAEYKLQIYTSPDGWSLPGTTTTYTLTTTYQPTTKYENGTDYWWRVVPLDTYRQEGTASEQFTFRADYNPDLQLLEPADDSEPTFTPTFRWTAVRGAQTYWVEYSTTSDFSANVKSQDTRNTSWTPKDALANDVDYYWHVKVISGNSESDWYPSESWSFRKKWYIKPVLLTPTNNYQNVRFPLLSWTPVPGAARYEIQLDEDSNFYYPIYEDAYVANTFFVPTNSKDATKFYWRVRPYDGSGNPGVFSDPFSYDQTYLSLAPQQAYPLYYYRPDTYTGYPGVITNPHEDRTVPVPIFIWNRVLDNTGGIYADQYRVQVSTDPNFNWLDWTVDTENTSATPTVANPFLPLADTDYYWRIATLIGGSLAGPWSQTWKVRFDNTLGLTPTVGLAPSLIRPTNGYEFAEATPLFEWFPLTGATSYQVQTSTDVSFGAGYIVDTGIVPYPAYAPLQDLAQRAKGDIDFPVFYWRVSADGANWSEPQRFQIAAQSQWRFTRSIGDAANQLQIGSDQAGEVTLSDPDYDLTSLQVAESMNHFYFGFHVPEIPDTDVDYALYLDLDHEDNSGAVNDARGYDISTIPGFRPEYIVYILRRSGAFSESNVIIHDWNEATASWDPAYKTLADFTGVDLSYSSNYVEFRIPITAIGYSDQGGSYSISLVSLPVGSGSPQDSVPMDPNIPGTEPISHFASVTERMNLVMPPNSGVGVDPNTYPSVQPAFWDWPVSTPFSGALGSIYLDPEFSEPEDNFDLTAASAYFARMTEDWVDDITGDNTYYWRIQPKYRNGTSLYLGVGSQGNTFFRKGFVPTNLQISTSFTTPTFSWDRVEGAESYDLQVDDDPGFGNLDISTVNTKQNTYTNKDTLPNGTYYWRVRARRNGGITNEWSVPTIPCPATPVGSDGCFNQALPIPTGLYHQPEVVVRRAPTLCWTPLIQDDPFGDPFMAAYTYVLQVSKVPFPTSSIFESVETQQSCWTGAKSYADSVYYWHVAMKDGNGRQSVYSDTAQLTKQYDITTLISPITGSTVTSTPTFTWTPVNGAAHYRLEISINDNFSPLYESAITTDFTSYTPLRTYAAPRIYYWRVAIVDDSGSIGPFNTAVILLNPYLYSLYLPYARRP